MTPDRHPPEDLLLSYAAGGLPEPVALLVATHLALCPPCRAQCDDFVTLGGVILESTAGDPVSPQCLERTLARLDAEDEGPADPPSPPMSLPASLPRPLAGYLPGPLPSLPWTRIGNRIAEIRLLRRYPGFATRLVRVKEGTRIARHCHDGIELTLVLAGGYSCGSEPFRAGDVAVADETVTHRPVVDTGEPCLCLVVDTGPIRLVDPWGRLLNPLLRLGYALF